MKTLVNNAFHRTMRLIRPRCKQPHAFSQEGEDLILSRVFETRRSGFYVDVGAHHPTRYSNTYLFYRRGWRGINIDAMPGCMAGFERLRPNDINLELAIGERHGALAFHIFNETALNTFDLGLAKERDGQGEYRVVEMKMVQLHTLAEVLEQHLPTNQAIDFMSVDAEGYDLSVLRSNDWERFKPEYVLAEDCSCEMIEDALKSPLGMLLRTVGYALFAKTVRTQIYKRC